MKSAQRSLDAVQYVRLPRRVRGTWKETVEEAGSGAPTIDFSSQDLRGDSKICGQQAIERSFTEAKSLHREIAREERQRNKLSAQMS